MNAYLALVLYLLPFFLIRPKDPFQPELFLNIYFLMLIGLGPIVLYVFSRDIYNTGKYDKVLILVVAGYVFINLGFMAARLKFGKLSQRESRWSPAQCRDWIERNRRSLKLVSYVLLMAGVLSGLLFFLRAGEIPILAENKEVARVEALSVGGNGYLLYFMTAGMYAIAFFSLIAFSGGRNSRREIFNLLFVFAIVGLLLTGTGSRRYLLWMFLYMAISRHYLGKRISVFFVLFLSIVGLLLVNMFEMFRNPDSLTTTDLVTTFFFRFILYVSNLEKVFSTFFEMGHLMYGSTLIMDLATVLPGKQIDYQTWLKELVGLDFEGFGLPPTLMGDLYINFGWGGVILGCFAFGYTVRKIYSKLIISSCRPFAIVTYILLLEIASKVITSGVSPQMMGIVWVTAALGTIFLLFKAIKKRRRAI